MNFLEISFPVFKLPAGKPLEEDGVVFYQQEYKDKETDAVRTTTKIIDDKTIDLPNLSLRRLRLRKQNKQLYAINTAIYFLGDLVKLTKNKTWWIDSNGKLFEYKKSTRAKLKFYKLDKCFTTDNMGAIVQVCGLPQRFKTMFFPAQHENWCAVLEYQGIKIFYGFYAEPHQDTWRMI